MRILLMYGFADPSPGHVARLRALDGRLDVVVAGNEAEAVELAPDAEVILGHRYLRQCLPRAGRLRWVQSTSGGVDRLPCDLLARRGVKLTRVTLFAPVIATHAVAMAWALARALPQSLANQRDNKWEPRLPFLPPPRRALVLGAGAIGREIARCLRAQEIHVSIVKRTPEEPGRIGCDEVFATAAWREALPRTDWCFLALPLTPGTRGIFDAEAIRALPSHAVLVNVGRAETLDQAALRDALAADRLGGAGLDVVDPSPPDPGDPLWTSPRCILTPHVAAHDPHRQEAIEAFFEAQVAAYLRGEPLSDEVPLGGETG